MQSTRADSDKWIRSGIWCNQTMDQGRAEDLRSSPHEIMQFSMSTFSDESGSIPSYDIHIVTLTCTELIQAREYQADQQAGAQAQGVAPTRTHSIRRGGGGRDVDVMNMHVLRVYRV